MKKSVAIVDYGIGNLLSVRRAFEHVGAQVTLATDAAHICSADYLVLPGVGAFRDGMAGLRDRGLVDALLAHAAKGRPMLGICLGAQMLMSSSVEFGSHQGLNLVPGCVVPIPAIDIFGHSQKLPFIGWAELVPTTTGRFAATPLAQVRSEDAVYLVHSYFIETERSEHRLATYDYGGHAITAAIRSDNILGMQFHPEKSGPVGLRILESFLAG
jgi:glutamine amidotransferase